MGEDEAGGADACGCTACAGSGVMCRVKRGTLRSGEFGKGKWTLGVIKNESQ